MEIRDATTDGLKRTLQVVVGAQELNERFANRLGEMQRQAHLKGFRKGKVPVSHLKKMFGTSVMAEIIQQTVSETTKKALEERKERPAMQPAIEMPEDQAEIDRVIKGEADLAYSISFEVMPEIKLADASQFKLERLVAEADEEAVQKALEDLAERNVSYEPEEGREAADGDRVTMDFIGKIDGEPFEGGAGNDVQLVIGSSSFIPGFEDGLKGAKAGEDRAIDVTFPEDYNAEHLAGKAAVFDLKIKEVAAPLKPDIDDAFAVGMGAESLDKLKQMLKERIEREYADASRFKLKRELLDKLDENHDFELPPTLVEREFEAIWTQLSDEMKRTEKTFEGENEEADKREEYMKIARRRVRLGLIIGEIAEKNKIDVTEEELRRALAEKARSFPGQEKQVYEFFQKNPNAIADIRTPIFEDKVVDFILELAKPSDKSVSKDDLFKQVEALQEA